MAVIVKEIQLVDPKKFNNVPQKWLKVFEAEEEELDKLYDTSAKIDPDVSLVGGLATFSVADGQAYYLILNNEDPLQLAWIKVFDNYSLPAWQLVGFTTKEAKRMFDLNKHFQ